jgi:hypothetical protein
MERQSFIFHKEWAEAMKKLPKDVRVEVYDAIIEYGLSGTTSAALKPVADALFTVFRVRLDADMKRYEETVNRRREAGLKGGIAFARKCEQNRAKQSKREQNRANALIDNDIDNVVPNRTDNNIDKSNDLSHCGKSAEGQKAESLPAGFAEFWSIYPKTRRVAKRDCVKKWKLHKFEAIADKIVADVRRQSASDQWTKDDGRFVPMPSTYLNQRRWEDAGDEGTSEASSLPNERQTDGVSSQEKHRKFLIRLVANGSDMFSLYEKNISEAEFLAANREEIEREREKIALAKGAAL